MQKRINTVLLLAMVLMLVAGCDSKAEYDVYKSVPEEWHKDSIASFKFEAPDTIQNYNLYVQLRNTNAYRYSNLFLIVQMRYPNGKTIKDTLEYRMAKPNGELLGTGFSDIKENKLWYRGYKAPFSFTETGDYLVQIQHAMRKSGEVKGVENLQGIMDVGFRVEPAQIK